ncbi:glycine cleavage system protein GcvH [Spiribacter aquaticus]|jgi:glycine cleavage system H protein|uniref:Glycine cleavage system H protein n=2 Tax=Spiribacter TaxID=1335745 RepID=A0A557RM62_9GAMM|nr:MULTISPECIES: glycine cleavage system protein GcvH [Spiribacter]AUB79102.1 glycine cleavage system protein H [Spiribacter roseus]KAF0279294.1 glycine cleavage system protein H [Spiribacter roseus]KAF0285594.1 glycine cleavage system protein H [Spiribacter sp. SSL99]TVO66253.1 glycine cleavage system protein GcvH [Spiribacter aquaticus]
MSEIPADLRYASSHEWVRDDGDGMVTVGITDHAQAELGDLVFIQLPGEEGAVEAGAACAVVESVKAASDIYAPLDGEIVATHDELADDPEQVNTDPYGEGWLFRLRVVDQAALDELLDADGYAELIDEAG